MIDKKELRKMYSDLIQKFLYYEAKNKSRHESSHKIFITMHRESLSVSTCLNSQKLPENFHWKNVKETSQKRNKQCTWINKN